MSRIQWRWAEKDFGFRFQSGGGRSRADYYQASEPGAFYVVPAKHRKLTKNDVEKLAVGDAPTSPRVVPTPWRNYELDWDWIETDEGTLLNFAGCLDPEEIKRREDEGVARAMELVNSKLALSEPVPLSSALVQQIHVELMGTIYPFAGRWREVDLHKGVGPTKWPLPPMGIAPLMELLERDVFSRSPFLSEDDNQVFDFVSEVMGEILALHPFREGNGRTTFIVCNLLLLQNDMLPLHVYDRRADQDRYYAACEDARIYKNYAPLSKLVAEWEQAALKRWEAEHGG